MGGRLEPRLQGHVLREGRCRALRPERLPNGERGLRSETLGLRSETLGLRSETLGLRSETLGLRSETLGLRSETLGLWAYLQGPEQALRWHDPMTGKDLEDYEELYAAREATEEELAELRVQTRRLGREPAT